jgi:hypothetical protein
MLSADGFQHCVREFVASGCASLWFEDGVVEGDGWTCDARRGVAFLHATVLRRADSAAASDVCDDGCAVFADVGVHDGGGLLEVVDAAALPPSASRAPLQRLHYHVVYDETFRAATLLFRGDDAASGAPLSLRAIIGGERSRATVRVAPGAAAWPLVTQEEHPLLGGAFFKVHPCRSEAAMAQLLGSDAAEGDGDPLPLRYLLAWLALVGRPASLPTPRAARWAALLAQARARWAAKGATLK